MIFYFDSNMINNELEKSKNGCYV